MIVQFWPMVMWDCEKIQIAFGDIVYGNIQALHCMVTFLCGTILYRIIRTEPFKHLDPAIQVHWAQQTSPAFSGHISANMTMVCQCTDENDTLEHVALHTEWLKIYALYTSWMVLIYFSVHCMRTRPWLIR